MQKKLSFWVLVSVLGLAGCQTRGDVRPLTSEIEPPPRMVVPQPRCAEPGASAVDVRCK